ncbi:hypothetical protein F5Y16DRAFT_375091 [Xylariaceae sp. FL0255]|nr:hypothetical protein F5Y16DRAFT_375091 [Xylariaceae sp. FL0255]
MDKKTKPVYSLNTPYSTVAWPQISIQDQDTILELLCSLLIPLGNYRAQYSYPSKGNRARKRKRKHEADQQDVLPVPPVPDLQSRVDIGLSSVTRGLQKMVADGNDTAKSPEDEQSTNSTAAGPCYSLIFVPRSAQPTTLSSHLPQMVAVASKAHPSRTPPRLVGFSKACEDRLSEALGIPRVSCIGLHDDALNAKPLVDFARAHVPIVEVPWLEEASRGEYRDTKIDRFNTVIGTKQKRNKI